LAVNGTELPSYRSHTLKRGDWLEIGPTAAGVWGYLAVSGGVAVDLRLDSRSTHLRSAIGGFFGRKLQEGDIVPLHSHQAPNAREREVIPPPVEDNPSVRVVLGPQSDFFSPETCERFLSSAYQVTHRSDRMGAWLEGPPLQHARGFNVISDGIVPGCIQVPGSGQPLVLLMDCQTIGGYPKLATIISADLPRFAQTRPGRTIAFRAIPIADAQEEYRRSRTAVSSLVRSVREIWD
jgi:biotin-dependent carboxylase-like uncharacterized protein